MTEQALIKYVSPPWLWVGGMHMMNCSTVYAMTIMWHHQLKLSMSPTFTAVTVKTCFYLVQVVWLIFGRTCFATGDIQQQRHFSNKLVWHQQQKSGSQLIYAHKKQNKKHDLEKRDSLSSNKFLVNTSFLAHRIRRKALGLFADCSNNQQASIFPEESDDQLIVFTYPALIMSDSTETRPAGKNVLLLVARQPITPPSKRQEPARRKTVLKFVWISPALCSCMTQGNIIVLISCACIVEREHFTQLDQHGLSSPAAT